MIRLGSSQILLTNRDVTRTLNPRRCRRQPTVLYTKGRAPIRSMHTRIPYLNTSSPNFSEPRFFHHNDIHPHVSTSLRPPSPVWSTSSSDSIPDGLPDLIPANATNDGTIDTSIDFEIENEGPLRQVVSLASADSFPFLPSERESSYANLRIHEDEIRESDSETSYEDEYAYEVPTSSPFASSEEEEGELGDEDEPGQPILTESIWAHNVLLGGDTRPVTPERSLFGDNQNHDGTGVNTGLFETPPRR